MILAYNLECKIQLIVSITLKCVHLIHRKNYINLNFIIATSVSLYIFDYGISTDKVILTNEVKIEENNPYFRPGLVVYWGRS